MGNTQGPGIRRDRRQELILLFYFIFGFVLIRVWILLIQSNSVIVESIGAIVTFSLLFTLLLRCRVIRRQEEAARIEAGQIDVNNPDIALLQALFRTPSRGISMDIINSLHVFSYIPEKYDNDPEEGVQSQMSTENNESLAAETSELRNVIAERDLESQSSLPHGIEVSSNACSICLSDYVEGETILMLPCRHNYHKACITEWLLGHTQCPLCKRDVMDLLGQQVYVHAQLERLRDTDVSNNRFVYNNDLSTAAPSPAPPAETTGETEEEGEEEVGEDGGEQVAGVGTDAATFNPLAVVSAVESGEEISPEGASSSSAQTPEIANGSMLEPRSDQGQETEDPG